MASDFETVVREVVKDLKNLGKDNLRRLVEEHKNGDWARIFASSAYNGSMEREDASQEVAERVAVQSFKVRVVTHFQYSVPHDEGVLDGEGRFQNVPTGELHSLFHVDWREEQWLAA